MGRIVQLNTEMQGIDDNMVKMLKVDFFKKCKNELKCIICIEHLITPVTLNCGHIFCQFCLNQFQLEVKKKEDFKCPNCKVLITSQTRCRQIENLINAIYSDVAECLYIESVALI